MDTPLTPGTCNHAETWSGVGQTCPTPLFHETCDTRLSSRWCYVLTHLCICLTRGLAGSDDAGKLEVEAVKSVGTARPVWVARVIGVLVAWCRDDAT